jgi:hypothetical protein
MAKRLPNLKQPLAAPDLKIPITGDKTLFRYEKLPDVEAVRRQIKECEGRHVQQVAFSSFMDALTQVCFTCQKVRSTIEWEGNRSWGPRTEFKE